MSKNRNLVSSLLGLPLLGLSWGCSRDVVELGEHEGTQVVARGARCVDSVVVTESVRVTSQAELDELTGCQAVQGDLSIWYIKDVDLTALSALRTVSGELQFVPNVVRPLLDENNEIVPGAEGPPGAVHWIWVGSLHGLEALESIGGLSLVHTAVPDFSELSRLRFARHLYLDDNDNLTDLRGLENVHGWNKLELTGDEALDSLEGLQVESSLDGLMLLGLPALTNIDALAPVTQIADGLFIQNAGIENLDALSDLTFTSNVGLYGNQRLEDVSGLSSLSRLDSLTVHNNPALRSIPAFPHVLSLELRSLSIYDNASLETVSLDFPIASQGLLSVGSNQEALDVGAIQIGKNPRLRSIVFQSGLASAELLYIGQNVSLSSIDLGSFEHLDGLAIETNPNLTQLSLGSMQTINQLSVTDNPQLSTAALANVRTFGRTLSGNAD